LNAPDRRAVEVTLQSIIRVEIWFFISGLACVIGYQLLTGRINTIGLLNDKAESRTFSPARLQLLVATIAIAFYYIMQVLTNKDAGKMPELPDKFLLILGGSHTVYVGSKLKSLIASKLNTFLDSNRSAPNNNKSDR
jgi:hypothetical protein